MRSGSYTCESKNLDTRRSRILILSYLRIAGIVSYQATPDCLDDEPPDEEPDRRAEHDAANVGDHSQPLVTAA